MSIAQINSYTMRLTSKHILTKIKYKNKGDTIINGSHWWAD